MVDLSRHITTPHMMDFMAVSSYGVGKRESTGSARVTLDLQTDIRDRNVLLVEDIVDSGHTIAAVLQMLETRQPKTLKVCALLDKPERREAHVPIDYLGFTIPINLCSAMASIWMNIIETCHSLVSLTG
jgi:hypoxanthine phosphoribosyltransferase